MPYTPMTNFDAGRIPDTADETNFHLDATYVFDHLASNVIPDFNTNLEWLETALSGADTIVDSVAGIIDGSQTLETLTTSGRATFKEIIEIGEDSTISSIRFYDQTNDTFRQIRYVSTSDNWQVNTSGSGNNNLWHTGNDGSGSGLDADLLDGKHADEFGLPPTTTYAPSRQTFAVGTELLLRSEASILRTALVTVKLSTTDTGRYVTTGGGATLVGSWRARGYVSDANTLMVQRVA